MHRWLVNHPGALSTLDNLIAYRLDMQLHQVVYSHC